MHGGRLEIIAKISHLFVFYKIRLGLAALVVRVDVVKAAIAATVQIPRTLVTGVAPTRFAGQRDFILAGITAHTILPK